MADCDCDSVWEDIQDRCAGSLCCSMCAGFPAQWTSFLLSVSSGVVALAVSLYAYIRLQTSVLNLAFHMPWLLFVNSGLAGIIGGGLLLLLAGLVWAVFSRDILGYCLKAIFLVTLLLVAAGLTLATIGGFYVSLGARGEDTGWESNLRRTWRRELRNENSTAACAVQARLKCEGFNQDDCLVPRPPGANPRNCATRCARGDEDGKTQFNNVQRPGCKDRMNSFYGRWYLVLAIGCFIGAVATLVNFIVVLTGVSFRESK